MRTKEPFKLPAQYGTQLINHIDRELSLRKTSEARVAYLIGVKRQNRLRKRLAITAADKQTLALVDRYIDMCRAENERTRRTGSEMRQGKTTATRSKLKGRTINGRPAIEYGAGVRTAGNIRCY